MDTSYTLMYIDLYHYYLIIISYYITIIITLQKIMIHIPEIISGLVHFFMTIAIAMIMAVWNPTMTTIPSKKSTASSAIF